MNLTNTTLNTIGKMVAEQKKSSIKLMDIYYNNYNKEKTNEAFIKLYDYIGEVDGIEVEHNLTLLERDKALYEWNLYDSDDQSYIKTYDIERELTF